MLPAGIQPRSACSFVRSSKKTDIGTLVGLGDYDPVLPSSLAPPLFRRREGSLSPQCRGARAIELEISPAETSRAPDAPMPTGHPVSG
jgi:hypothetical protein